MAHCQTPQNYTVREFAIHLANFKNLTNPEFLRIPKDAANFIVKFFEFRHIKVVHFTRCKLKLQ